MNTIIEKIRAEVERLKKNEIELMENSTKEYGDYPPSSDIMLVAYQNVLSILSDLEKEETPMNPTTQEQPVKIDIRKELASIEFMGVNDARDTETIARHFYELGRQSKPKNCEGLEEEIERMVKCEEEFMNFQCRSQLIGYMARHFAQWGAEHRGGSEIPKDLESYAETVEDYYDVGEERGYLCTHRGDIKNAVLAGAKWQKEQDTRDMFMSDNRHFEKVYELGKKDMKEQMMKEAVEGEVINDGGEYQLIVPALRTILHKMDEGDKVRIIIIKEEKNGTE